MLNEVKGSDVNELARNVEELLGSEGSRELALEMLLMLPRRTVEGRHMVVRFTDAEWDAALQALLSRALRLL